MGLLQETVEGLEFTVQGSRSVRHCSDGSEPATLNSELIRFVHRFRLRLRSRWCRRAGLWWKRRHVLFGKARQQVISHRELINRSGDNDGGLLHIVLDDALIGIEIRVPCSGVVLDRILANSDARQPGLAERSVIRAAKRAAL